MRALVRRAAVEEADERHRPRLRESGERRRGGRRAEDGEETAALHPAPAVKLKPAFSNSLARPGRTASISLLAFSEKSMSVMSCTPPVMITWRMPSSWPILRNARHTPGWNEM